MRPVIVCAARPIGVHFSDVGTVCALAVMTNPDKPRQNANSRIAIVASPDE